MEMFLFVYLIVICLALCIDWYIAKQFYAVAKAKGYFESKYLWICFFMTFAGYLLVIALPDRGNTLQLASDELPDL